MNPVCVSVQQFPTEKGSTLKGKKLLPILKRGLAQKGKNWEQILSL